ncbi:MAG TPA: helix-turn-helix transcriptional regulator [Chitinophagaceae bacterium]|jgi:DNA-binding CsgD family transcriptional regulator|nr:helix-turn-helix transcriptional regulator [Chitinophagaceae bacterium]
MAKNKTSWLSYMGALQKQSFTPEQLNTEGLEKILNINQVTNAVFNHSIPWIYLLDYTSGKYLLVSNSMKMMLGYDPNYFMSAGLSLTFENYHSKHMDLFNEEIFPDRLEILKKIPYQEHPNYIFSYNFQFKTRRGEYINLLQRNCFVKSDENGNPLLSFGVITNVNHYKSENPVIQVVEKIDNTEFLGGTKTISTKAYYMNKEDHLFTKREKELLCWIAAGFTSKEIADKLFISEYTVINHRRNMMSKANARNVTELICCAIKNQIL